MARARAVPIASAASTIAVGRPRATSCAKLGPDSTAIPAPGSACPIASASNPDPGCAKPFAARTMWRGTLAVRPIAPATSVAWAAGTARMAMSASASVAARSTDMSIAGARATPGRQGVFWPRSRIAATTSARRAQSATLRPCAACACASAVPQAPAPMIAIESRFDIRHGLSRQARPRRKRRRRRSFACGSRVAVEPARDV